MTRFHDWKLPPEYDRRRTIPDILRQRIREYFTKGESIRGICRQLHTNRATVIRIVDPERAAKYNENRRLNRKPQKLNLAAKKATEQYRKEIFNKIKNGDNHDQKRIQKTMDSTQAGNGAGL